MKELFKNIKFSRSEYVTAFLTCLVVIFAFYNVVTWATQELTTKPPDPEAIHDVKQAVFAQINDPYEFSGKLKAAHDEINNGICYGRHKDFLRKTSLGWGERDKFNVYLVIQAIREAKAESKHDHLTRDLALAIELLEQGYQDKDVKALVSAHRIIHDLDTCLRLGKGTKEYWGATETFEGKSAHRKTKL